MGIYEAIQATIKEAMKARDERTLAFARVVKAELDRKGDGKPLPDEEAVKVLKALKEIALEQGNAFEAEFLDRFLPKEMSEEELEAWIREHVDLSQFKNPLAAIGVVGTLLLTNTPFSMQAYIGVIMLAGIVVSNAILLVDYTNTLRHRDKLGIRQAIETAGVELIGDNAQSSGGGRGAAGRRSGPLRQVAVGGHLEDAAGGRGGARCVRVGGVGCGLQERTQLAGRGCAPRGTSP